MPTVQSPLTKLGYNMVAWPKTDIHPLALLYKTANGVGAVEADLEELFKPGDAAPPQIKPSAEATDINGVAELTFDAKAGVSMLDWLLNKLNLGKLSADVTLNDSYVVTVLYRKVKEDKVNLLLLDGYISNSVTAITKFNTFKEKLENSELFVINSVVKSSDISITISDKNGQDINLDATVKGIVDANASAARKKSNTLELVYKTDEDKPVIFAFKAQQIVYENASFWNNEPAHFKIVEQIGLVLLNDEDIPTRPLISEDILVGL